MKIEGDNYKERSENQLKEWVKGDSIHNETDDECCPDFSCCNKQVNTPVKVREAFLNSDHNTRLEYLCGFLGDAMSNTFKDKNIYLPNDKKLLN